MTTSATAMKRFYKQVSTEAREGGFAVLLDGRIVKTPEKVTLVLPTEGLAKAVAAEWDRQEKTINPETMPMMSLACTGIDWVANNRNQAEEGIGAYAEHDLLCYWDDSQPELLARQKQQWQPLLDWAALIFDAPLQVTTGLMSVAQPEDAVRALRNAVCGYGDLELSVLSSLVREGGSLIVGLALLRGHLDTEAALDAVLLHEKFQIERWGEDEEAAARQVSLSENFRSAMQFWALLHS